MKKESVSCKYSYSTQYHVFDLTRPLATFSMYKMINISSIEEPRGYVTFLVNERIPRVRPKIFYFLN